MFARLSATTAAVAAVGMLLAPASASAQGYPYQGPQNYGSGAYSQPYDYDNRYGYQDNRYGYDDRYRVYRYDDRDRYGYSQDSRYGYGSQTYGYDRYGYEQRSGYDYDRGYEYDRRYSSSYQSGYATDRYGCRTIETRSYTREGRLVTRYEQSCPDRY